MRVIATYPVYSHTFDEPVHLAAGVEWWSSGKYTYDVHHPPLARAIMAAAPVYAGAHTVGRESVWSEAAAMMRTGRGYDDNLRLARLALLPLFVLACLVVWWWGRRLGGEAAGAFGVVIFSLAPPVVAHAGLATTDMPHVATFLALCATWLVWSERPRSVVRGIALGIAGGVALATKFSAVPFFGITLLVTLPLLRPWRRATWRELGNSMGAACILAFVVLWASYRFSIGSADGFYVPFPEFFVGLSQVAQHNAEGHSTYLLGHAATSGRWDFFPVVFAVKTPLAILLLLVLSAGWAFRHWRRSGRTEYGVVLPLFIALAIFCVVLPININNGVRHILPIYGLVAVAAGAFVARSWLTGGTRRILGASVLGILLLESTLGHPDALAYFNALVPNEPGRVLVDSDLDWGQDLHRLRDTVQARRISSLALAYYGSTDHVRDVMPAIRPVSRHAPDTGWIAISETYYRMGWISYSNGAWHIDTTAYRWLHEREPVARVGKSIRLYRVFGRGPT